MASQIDDTHDPGLESWVESANDPGTDFPIQNLPLCRVLTTTTDGEPTAGLASRIGDLIVNIDAILGSDLVDPNDPDWRVDRAIVEDWIPIARNIRRGLQKLLAAGNPTLRDHPDRDLYVSPAAGTRLAMPFTDTIPDFTDFYASVHHATNVGSMFRPDNPLLPNYKWIPVGYHGRASSVVPSGTDVVRPLGQRAPAEEGGAPGFGPSKMLDYELELGIVLGRGNALGRPIPIGEAEQHVLGVCLLNDWSARDLQKWEYVPLGPFLAKSFASTISPYIVTMDALAPFRVPAYERPAGDPAPLEHLDSDHDRAHGAVDITLEVSLSSERMRANNIDPVRLSAGSFKDMYWTIAQMLTHHASNGCPMRPGDLLGSGTVSGPTRGSRGCLLELTWDGDPWANPPVIKPGTERTPITLPTGEQRTFLADGDEVILKGFCEREGYRRIGFGECRGTVRPSPGSA